MLQQFLLSLTFFTRIPLPKRWQLGEATLAQSAWAFPLAGAISGGLAGVLSLIMRSFGLNYGLSAWVALGFLVLLTGGLHEDGLADMADGMAYGRDREQKLSIMRDSRIGSYGVLALVIVLAIRANAMAGLSGGLSVIWALAAAGACSRAYLAVLMYALPSARHDGMAAQAGRPSGRNALIAAAIGLFALVCSGNFPAVFIGLIVLAAVYMAIGRIATKQFGGITGDVLGAAQQLAEAALLVVFTVYFNRPHD